MIRRVAFSTLAVSNHGIGIALDFGHLFQTERTVDMFCGYDVTSSERQRLRDTFDRLRGRRDRRKGTLLYNTGSRVTTCYFSHFEEDATCKDVGPLEFAGSRYESLYHYYRTERPRLHVEPDDPVVYVSFPTMKGEKPVAAKLLRLRVNLDPGNMPRVLRTRTTIPPDVRSRWSEQVWSALPKKRIQENGFRVSSQLWRPGDEAHELLPCPTLIFGQGRQVNSPANQLREDYKTYYRTRREKVQRGGIYRFDENAGRDLVIVTPLDSSRWSAKLQKAFVDDLVSEVDHLAGRRFRARVVRAEGCDRIVEALKREKPSVAVIVFDDRNKATYSVLSHELSPWIIKRITRRTLERAFRELQNARSDVSRRRAERSWNDLLFHSAIDVLDQMGATPWRLQGWPYEACLAIDVSEQRRYFGLSLIICRDESHWPSFYRVTRTWPKGDHQYETIAATLLTDKLESLMAELLEAAGGFDPIDSLLVLRDGRDCGDELSGIDDGLDRWRSLAALRSESVVDVASVLKRSVKNIRIWRRADTRVRNVLEGQALYLDDRTAVVSCTGAATLPARGTAEPIVLQAHNAGDIRRIARGVFALSQLNYSSPAKAHRYPQPLREVDVELRDRVDHDMRGIK